MGVMERPVDGAYGLATPPLGAIGKTFLEGPRALQPDVSFRGSLVRSPHSVPPMTAAGKTLSQLTPLQRGMVLHALEGADRGVDVEQIVCTVGPWRSGDSDQSRSAAAGTSWRTIEAGDWLSAFHAVAARHPLLRSRVRVQGLELPVLEVQPFVEPELQVVDGEQHSEARLSDFLRADRERGFDLEQGPLWRLAVQPRDEHTVLIWTLHHLLLDGRAFATVLAEVFTELAIPSTNCEVAEHPSAPHDADVDHYACWQAEQDPGPGLEWYETEFAGFSSAPPLPETSFGERRSGERTASFALDERRTKALQHACNSLGVTLHSAVQTAWSVILGRVGEARDVAFGSTRTTRSYDDAARSGQRLGLFINTLPVRASWSSSTTFAELLVTTRQKQRASRDHVHVPLAGVLSRVGGAGGRPLFESLVVYDHETLEARVRAAVPDAPIECIELHERPSFPLALVAWGNPVLHGHLLFDGARFEPEVVEGMARSLTRLLSEMPQRLDVAIDRWDVLDEEEHRKILEEFNPPQDHTPRAVCLHQDFEARVCDQPDAVAVLCEDRRWSYAELEARANDVAHALLARGAGAGARVGLCLHRDESLVAALLAISKTGAAYVPLDPSVPTERLAVQIEDADANLVLCSERTRNRLPDSVQTLLLSEVPGGDTDRGPPHVDHDADALAYVIYTSGSTGKPKGVAVRHRAACNTLDWVNETFAVGPSDRLLFVTSPSFDLSVYDVFGILGAGASLVVATDEQLADPTFLVELLDSGEITFWDSAPAFLQQLTPFWAESQCPESLDPPESLEARDPSAASLGLRLIFLSGDWVPVCLPPVLRERFVDVQVVALGGATEAAIWSNHHVVDHVGGDWPSIPYGKPNRGCRYHVLDATRRPVPIGVPGDLYIGGHGLADGYFGDPRRTSERFLPDPFRPGDRLYYTGDRARYDAEGKLEFLGRRDHQVKIRGYRVELGEIEHVLSRHPHVSEAVVVAPVDANGERALAAFVVLRDGSRESFEGRAHLERSLPSWMIPTAVEPLDELPLTTNGKVDRAALEARLRRPHAGAGGTREPETELEQQLRTIWKDVLGLERVGVEDDFFDLGGHSLAAAQMLAAVSCRLGASATLSDVLAARTVRALARRMDSKERVGSGRFVAFHREGARTPLFLISGIGGHVFVFKALADQLGADQPLYAGKAIGVDGETDPPASIEAMAERYLDEILALQSRGPYLLGGYSAGGLVAFEVAAQLRRRGHDVRLLSLIDVLAPGYPPRKPWPLRLTGHLRGLVTPGSWSYLVERLRNLRERILRWAGREQDLACVPADADADTQEKLRRVWCAMDRATREYRPRHVLDISVAVFRAEQGFDWAVTEFDDEELGWGRFAAGDVLTFTSPGGHGDLFHAGSVEPLAADLRACMDGVLSPALRETGGRLEAESPPGVSTGP